MKVLVKKLLIWATLIALCVFITNVFKNETGALRWIAFGSFVMIMVGGFVILFTIPKLLNAWIPPVDLSDEEEKLAKRVDWVLGVVLVASLTILIIEIDVIDNTLKGMSLVWKSAALGFSVTMISLITTRQFSFLWRDEKRRFWTPLCAIFTAVFLFIASASFTNRWFGSDQLEYLDSSFVRKSKGSGEREAYYLFIETDNTRERLVVDKAFWEAIDEDANIILKARKGFWGNYVVVGFDQN